MADIQPTADRPFFKPLPEHDNPNTLHLLWRLAGRMVISSSACWEWQGAKTSHGYGHITFCGRNACVHRLVYSLCVAAAPAGLFVLHRCDNRCCCNPAHLFVGTHRDNMRDMAEKRRAARTPMRGEKNGRAVLSETLVRSARHLAALVGARAAARKLSAQTGISFNTLRSAIRGKTWRLP